MEPINRLNGRLTKAQDVLVDLRQMIDRLAGNQSANDQRRSSTSSNYNASATTDVDPFFYLDKEATDELVSDISDTLRDAQDDFDLLREDALDLGVMVSETTTAAAAAAAATVGDGDEADAAAAHHTHTSRSLRPSSFGASLRSSSAHSGGSGGGSRMSSSFTEDDASATSIRSSIEGVRLQRGLVRLGEGLADARRAFRRAQLAARRHREDAQREMHRQILASYIEEIDEDEDKDGDEENENENKDSDEEHTARSYIRTRPATLAAKHTSPTTSAAADVTAALRQTHARIAGEVARSDFAAQTLAESSRALAELGDKYGSGGASSGGDINSSLKSAGNLVRGLVAAHKSDTWYLQTAMYMVAATIVWLLFRRLLYGPLWLLVWWPVRTVFGTAAWVGRAGTGGSGSGKNAVSSVSIGESPLTTVVTSVAMVTGSVPAEAHATEAAQASGSLVEEVGRVIDESYASDTTATSEASLSSTEEAPNPKKRMWEEPVEAAKHEEQLRKENEEREQKERTEQEGKGKQPADGERKKDEL
ncbi:Protein transport protein sec20 [Sporothrix curviconia]|uniref:Protein transport protein sec20 n=1 Tax=Sporothrix curviconia TaxID=1260050 RepID=A0ABP0BPD0_9PEZI